MKRELWGSSTKDEGTWVEEAGGREYNAKIWRERPLATGRELDGGS